MTTHYDETESIRSALPPLERDDPYCTGEEFGHFLRHAERLERSGGRPRSLRAWLDLAESWRITRALHDCGGNRSAAARALGIGRRTLYAKMDKLDISPRWEFRMGGASKPKIARGSVTMVR